MILTDVGDKKVPVIKVVRGATGLTTGAGDPSGTINMVRKRPTDAVAMSAGITVGRWGNQRLEADIGGPVALDGRVRARFVAAKQQSDSFRDVYALDKDVFYGIVQADLSDSTLFEVGYEYQSPKTTGVTWGVVPYWGADGKPANLPRSTNLAPKWSYWQRETSTVFANLEQHFGENWLLKVNTAYTRGNVQNVRLYGSGYPDPTTGAGIYLRTAAGDSEDTRRNVDAYLSGTFNLFGREHDVTLGGQWSDLESTTNTVALNYPTDWARCGTERCYYIPNIRSWDGDISEVTYTRTGARRVARTRQSGVYLATRLRLADPLSLIAGAR